MHGAAHWVPFAISPELPGQGFAASQFRELQPMFCTWLLGYSSAATCRAGWTVF